MRKLASIQKIAALNPIEGKDRIELATILGWCVIVKKGEFAVGDSCVFCEIDSVLPEKPEFEFLRPKKFRIKTMKLGSVYSQGIVFPLDILPKKKNGKPYELDEDVTAVIGVTQYEPTMDKEPDDLAAKQTKTKWPKFLMRYAWFRRLTIGKAKKKGGFPSFISKTDETRCLSADAKVLTDQGLIRIADICNKKLPVKVWSLNEKNQQFELAKIADYQVYGPEDEKVKLTFPFRHGMNRTNSLVMTLDHKVLTQDGYKVAADISVGDRVCYFSNSYRDEAIPYVYGMLLGDSHMAMEDRLQVHGGLDNGVSIHTAQGEKQSEYILFKQRLFGEDNFIIRRTKSGYKEGSVVWQGAMPRDACITQALYDDGCIVNRKFVVTQAFCDRLTPASLALWYLDDGTCRHLVNEVYNCHSTSHATPAVEISTNSFTEEEVRLLIDTLNLKFGIGANIRLNKRNGKIYPSIYIRTSSTNLFMETIAPYVPECMRYKLTDGARKIPCEINNLHFEKINRPLWGPIISAERLHRSKFARNDHVYDIEVEKNHNFVAGGIVHHNCQNNPSLLQNKREWVASEKCDGQSGTWALVRHKRHWPFHDKFEYIVCSRNLRLNVKDNSSYWKISDKYQIENALRNMIGDRDWIAIQGECVGPKIQGNKYKLADYDMYVFNLIYPTGRLDSITAKSIIENKGMNFVPIVSEHYVLPDTMEQALEDATGPSALNPDTLREGFVIRSKDGKESWKIVSPAFLEKYNA